MLEERDCPGCGRAELFEVVTCDDGHGGDCPERACTSCGALVLAGPVPLAPPLRVVAGAA